MVDRRKYSRTAREYKVLYFITAPAPEDEEREDILRYGPGAVFRNANYIDNEMTSGFEPCAAVTAYTPEKVPEPYARYFPAAVPFDEFLAGGLPDAPEHLDAAMLAAQAPAGDMPPMTTDPFTVGRPSAPAGWSRNT